MSSTAIAERSSDEKAAMLIPGRRKAAILCVALGSERAAEIFKHLPPDVIEQLTLEMARTPSVEPEHATTVMEEILQIAYARGYLAEGGVHYAREVLARALGPERASDILERLNAVIESSPFEFLNGSPPEQI